MAMRPESAKSKTAWATGDELGVDNPAMSGRPVSRQSFGGDELGAAMENDLYDSTVQVTDDRNQPVVQVQEPEGGCWFKFKRGIRCKYIKMIID